MNPNAASETFATPLSGTFSARYVSLIASVAALGGLLFGYDWVVIGGAKPFYEPYFQLTSETLSGWANSCALLGCLFGSLVCGVLSDRFGRKGLLLLAALLFVVSSLLTGWAHAFSAFVFWRIVGGVAIGIASKSEMARLNGESSNRLFDILAEWKDHLKLQDNSFVPAQVCDGR